MSKQMENCNLGLHCHTGVSDSSLYETSYPETVAIQVYPDIQILSGFHWAPLQQNLTAIWMQQQSKCVAVQRSTEKNHNLKQYRTIQNWQLHTSKIQMVWWNSPGTAKRPLKYSKMFLFTQPTTVSKTWNFDSKTGWNYNEPFAWKHHVLYSRICYTGLIRKKQYTECIKELLEDMQVSSLADHKKLTLMKQTRKSHLCIKVCVEDCTDHWKRIQTEGYWKW